MQLTLGSYVLDVPTDFGPRITGLRRDGGGEQFAQLGDDVVIDHEGGQFLFRGGHRCWVAPEIPRLTYADDRGEIKVTESGTSVSIVSVAADPPGLFKQIRVTADGDTLTVDHAARGTRVGPRMAAWGITQLPLGGTAVLPLAGDDSGAQANRYLVLWPYTSLNDPRVTFLDDAILVRADDGPPLKVGIGPNPGRLGYLREGSLFIKEIEPAAGREVPDFGAVGQVYVGQGFCELESMGALADFSDGETATLTERWRVVECPDLDTAREILRSPL